MTFNETKLPQMQEMLGPWWPMPQSNLHWDGRRREDLPDDAQIHCYHGWWTFEELTKYGALPAKRWGNQ